VRRVPVFFPGPRESMHSDQSACYAHLRHADFGFVHQVLSFERVHESAVSTELQRNEGYLPGILRDLVDYGKYYLTEKEYETCLRRDLAQYYGYLATSALKMRSRKFWYQHARYLRDLGYPLKVSRLGFATCSKIAETLVNPSYMLEKISKLLRR
jgi:hypothetical protein